ncbi:hypothetical protein DMN91_005178 [Ooceraea biroi]|uniref:Uncharacterized protein n=1 Tax=Ooceraea biroi TaxID=2015173 RepID=A0A3L8DR59_OOCBI|nr:uncharacterized protein LOC105281230 isoform X1 [Ooceraea biroi]XP_011340606.2 uncharacterized protein LOC105281230 isoform X1 [Ooceraea biroi]RLU22900.1 hypothetical protein DMN91_005178 [Ooceraea biroi]
MKCHNNFGRGRGFGPRGTRATASFSRPRFPRPPFRHIGPPRPGHPASFGNPMPWQPNMMFQPQGLHNNPQFRPAGRRRRICSYDVRFPPPNRLPVPPGCEENVLLPSNNPQLEDNQTCTTAPQVLLPGSEEERQQKIAKTADRLKQKLSCFNTGEMTNIWSDDVSLPPAAEDDCAENKTLGCEQSELNLTHNDLKDIGRINVDNLKYDDAQDLTDTPDTDNISINEQVSSENRSDLEVVSNQMTNVECLEDQENLPCDNNCTETEQWNPSESIEDSHNLEQTDLQDTNAENQLSEADQCQYNVPSVDVLQDRCDKQDISQETEVNPTSQEQDVPETPNLRNTQLSDQDNLQNNMLKQKETKPVANLEVQENVLNSHSYTNNLSSNSNKLSQPAPSNVPVLNNVALDNRLPRITESSFHSGPPRLSPHIEQKLPIDFDPSTPPPILMKQDQSVNVRPPLLIRDLPPLFNPTEPPPNMRVGLQLPHENPTPTWNINTQNQVPAVYNTEVHMDLNAHVGFTPQQLPLEMSSQSNVFLAPPIDPINFSPLFSLPPSNHPIINTNVPLLPQAQIVPHNACVPQSSSQEPLLPVSDCNVNKDDVLNDMQEAMKFAQQMTSITESMAENVTENRAEKNDERSKSNSTPLSENNTSVDPVDKVESISLPPGKPKVKPVKLKRTKRDDTHSKKSEVPEEPRTSDNVLSDEVVQDDANIRFQDAPIVSEQDRPKVVFNLNNKTIKVNTKTAWKEDTSKRRPREKRNGMTQPARSETMRATVNRKNLASTSRRREERKKNFNKSERIDRRAPSETTVIQTASPHRKIQKDDHKEKSQHPNVSSCSKPSVQKLRSCVEKNESSNSEISWKTNVINRFLKMSRNDIYNMVNNTSLRKFDVIMKRLVKEQKPTLSLELRQAQDEKMKLYDQQEFMKQLNAMLDTATVSITDLPTDFIHHLNEVLQLDVQPNNQIEPAPTLTSQSSHSEDTSHMLDPVTYITEYETAAANIASEEDVRNRSHVIKSTYDKDVQIQHNRINDLNVKDDTCSTVISNKSSISSGKLSALQHDLDDIFSKVTKKNHAPIAIMRTDCTAEQRSAKKFDERSVSSKSIQRETLLEDDKARRTENCARWIENCDKWKKKEREEYTCRNLTKEEWEAKYGTKASAISSFPAIASSSAAAPSAIAFSSTTSSPALASSSTRMITACNKNLSNKPQDENSYPRRRHSSESSKHSSTRHRTMERDKHKRSRRHSDDRKHGVEYSGNNSNSSDSSSSSSSSSSDSSDSSDTEANVTKLLRVIKENEKVAKQMSLNEAIRDEVNAEIERERKQKSKKSSKKSRKTAKRKAKRKSHKKKKKQSKQMSTSSDSASDKDNNEETLRLLTENEIKKEVLEDQIQQEVIIKEEVDIGQEENTGDTEVANVSSRMESHDNLTSPLTQEALVIAAGAVRSYSEDKSTSSPTQPKTKAQLKQMPADLNDNKVPLNIFTSIPESLIMGDISENLRKTREAIEQSSCNQNTTEALSTVNNLRSQGDATDDTVHAPHDRSNENTISQLNATAHTLTDLSTVNVQNEVSASPNVSSKASLVTDAASPTDSVTQKQRPSKKIDIKTYYERAIKRRMNEQGGAKKSVDSCVASKQDSLLTQNSTEPKTVNNTSPLHTSASACNNSVRDSRLVSPARLATISTNSEDSIAQTIEKNIQQEEKGSELAETTLKHLKEDSNRIQTNNAVKNIDQRKSEKKATLTAKTSVNANVTTKSKATSSKLKKYSEIEANITEQKLQTKVSLDPKKFKNIRSEGGKELKLKKEMGKTVKAKKKSAITLKRDFGKNLASTRVRRSLQDTAKTEKTEFIEQKNTEETAKNDACEELPPKTTLNDITEAEAVEIENKKNENEEEISNSVSKLNVSTPSKTVPEAEASGTASDNKENTEDFLMSSEIRSSNAMRDTELSLNPANQVDKLDNKDLTESTNVPASIAKGDVSSTPESDISRSDNVDTQGKNIQLLINTYAVNNIEINDTNENNTESDILANTYKSASAEEDGSALGKIVESSSASNENSEEQQDTVEAVTSADSIGSPFKGFLQESIMAFEQSNLFNLELNAIDGGKKIKLLLDGCNVNYVTHVSCVNDLTHDTYKDIENEREHYEMLDSVTDYANHMSVNANQTLNITFTSPLFTLDKEPAANDKSDVMPDESSEGYVGKSSDEAVTAVLRDEDNDVGIDKDSGAEEQLGDEKSYTLNTELAIKESMFIINEEEIHDETRPKDLTDKLTTTTDPSLSDAVDTAISDDPLRLPDGQSTEHLNNHVYLETTLSAEKTSCDKLPDFESDEHLVNDMFYLDDRLQGTGEFDNKDDAHSHFSIHQQSPRYDITPTVTPETTMIAPDADLLHGEKSEQCEFNFKHISSVDNDCNLLARAPAKYSPLRADSRSTLNVPTKAALKEAATDVFVKSPNHTPIATEETTLRTLNKSQQSEIDLNYQTSAWRSDVHHNEETHVSKAPDNTITQDTVNTSTISAQRNINNEEHSHDEISIEQNKNLTSVDLEKRPYNIQRNPVVELRKMKELDNMLKKKMQKTSEKPEDTNYKEQKKRKDTILHKIKGKQLIKYRSGKSENLIKKLKNMKQSGSFGKNTREAILARMLEIDVEMHKLTTEKLKLHNMLQSRSTKNSANSRARPKPKSDDPAPIQPVIPSILMSQLTQGSETNRVEEDKHASSSKRSLIKQKKRVQSSSSEEDEIVPHIQRSKTPVIQWKKKPRIELTTRRKENEEERKEEDTDETSMTKQASVVPPASKKTDSLIDASDTVIGKDEDLESNAIIARDDTREQEIGAKTTKKAGSDTDKSVTREICSNNSTLEKSVKNCSDSRQNSTERETERADGGDVNKRSNLPAPSETARANSQPRSTQVRGTPEPLSIYSDDSTWDSLVQNTASEMHEKRKSTGLALLDEVLKKEAITKKMKAIARKRQKKQLNNFLKSVDNLTLEEEELPLSKLYIRKLQQKRDLLDSLSQRKEDMNTVDPKVLKNVDEVINAVAENRVEDLYERQSVTPASNDVPTTSNAPAASQSDKHQFYVDVEANANSDWACKEKENIDQVVLQQDSNEISGDVSNHVFKAVSQNKVSFYSEHNVEPDSSITPTYEGTLMENHSLDCERVNSKDLNITGSRNFDIKVSVPKTLIKDDFSLKLLQKFKGTEVNIAATGLDDSATNTFSTNNTEKPKENDKNSRCDLETVKSAEKNEDQMENTMTLMEKDKSTSDTIDDMRNELPKEQKTTMIDNVENAQSITVKPEYSNITGSEDSGDSLVGSNQYDKITDIAHDSNISNSIIEKVGTKEARSNAELEQSSNETSGSKQNYQNEENVSVTEEESSNKSKSHTSEEILDNSTGNTILADRMSEKSEESNETSIAQKSDLERASVPTLSFNKVMEKSGEASKKLRRRSGKSTPVRRSTRYTNENIKPNKINETDVNSNSSEQQSNSYERDLTIHRNKSPTEMHDERNLNNAKKNRVIQKEQNTSTRKTLGDTKSETKIENPVKPTAIAEPAASKDTTAKKRKHTMWEMMNCKVRVINYRQTLLEPDVYPKALSNPGIIGINPYAPSNISYLQHVACNKDKVMMPVLEKSSSPSLNKACDKDKTEIEILEEKPIKKSNDDDLIQESTSHATHADEQESVRTQYTVHKGPILDIKVFGNSFLAASEDGKIYRYSQASNGILNIYKGHKSAVTCLHIYKSDGVGVKKELMYSGSLDGTLRCYNILTGGLVKSPAQVNSAIQCMDQAWGMIFVGTKSGHVSRFYIKGGTIKGSSIQFSDNSVLALKATNEGPRKILIVASRSQPITIRDATSGLFLRTISSHKNHTVYSLMRHHNLIYCGTGSTYINVFDFTTGEQTIQYEAGVGIVCMRLYEQLLFAGCYDGNIYVFDTNNHKLVCSIRGPGNMLLSLEVVSNKIIAGTKDKRLHSWQMPNQVRALLKKIS